jgi:hypothetical protein
MENENTITITKKQFDALINRLEDVEKGHPFRRPERVKEHIAYLRSVDGKPVVKIGNAEESYNKALNKTELKLPVYLKDETKPTLVDYLLFLNENNQIPVKVIKQTAIEKISSGGIYPKHDPATDKILPNEEVDLVVTTVDYEVEVEITDGELKGTKLTVPATALNI